MNTKSIIGKKQEILLHFFSLREFLALLQKGETKATSELRPTSNLLAQIRVGKVSQNSSCVKPIET
jgi:hypothetical protein